eukprot:TRINITY_DN5437_c0_g1_i12.p3 TRINITY_DN5437_c0_g1~~TRINITY_DN5437_c0_g1_i12.p3  ORF type:complete len:102 (-),score=6.16 TRINITY_DN5437_c0_g1_i12:934-1239(-)
MLHKVLNASNITAMQRVHPRNLRTPNFSSSLTIASSTLSTNPSFPHSLSTCITTELYLGISIVTTNVVLFTTPKQLNCTISSLASAMLMLPPFAALPRTEG